MGAEQVFSQVQTCRFCGPSPSPFCVSICNPIPFILQLDGAVQEEAEVYYSDDEELEDAPPPPVETQPKFRITGVHMAGLGKNDKPDAAASKHKKWGGQKQQVGSRTSAPPDPFVKVVFVMVQRTPVICVDSSTRIPSLYF